MSQHICYVCERKMRPRNVVREFCLPECAPVRLPVTVFVCPNCGDEVYESKEIRKIERQIRRGEFQRE